MKCKELFTVIGPYTKVQVLWFDGQYQHIKTANHYICNREECNLEDFLLDMPVKHVEPMTSNYAGSYLEILLW